MEIFAVADAIGGYCDIHCLAGGITTSSFVTMVDTLPCYRSIATWNIVESASQGLWWHVVDTSGECPWARCFRRPGATTEGHLSLLVARGRNAYELGRRSSSFSLLAVKGWGKDVNCLWPPPSPDYISAFFSWVAFTTYQLPVLFVGNFV